MSFTLDDRLAADTFEVARLDLRHVGLMNDTRFPWLILVPMRADAVDLIDLEAADRSLLMQEISRCSEVLRSLFSPAKLNVAALGNMVPQLHVHVIARQIDDAVWPRPVWGHGTPEPYDEAVMRETCAHLSQAIRA